MLLTRRRGGEIYYYSKNLRELWAFLEIFCFCFYFWKILQRSTWLKHVIVVFTNAKRVIALGSVNINLTMTNEWVEWGCKRENIPEWQSYRLLISVSFLWLLRFKQVLTNWSPTLYFNYCFFVVHLNSRDHRVTILFLPTSPTIGSMNNKF